MEEVRNGTTILIVDRNRPVARLEPVDAEERAGDGLVGALGRKMVRLSPGVSAVQELLGEREEGR